MARVVLVGSLANRYTKGIAELEIPARNVRELLRLLEQQFPGLAEEIERAQSLAIDGVIYQDPFMQAIGADSEVYVLPKMAAG